MLDDPSKLRLLQDPAAVSQSQHWVNWILDVPNFGVSAMLSGATAKVRLALDAATEDSNGLEGEVGLGGKLGTDDLLRADLSGLCDGVTIAVSFDRKVLGQSGGGQPLAPFVIVCLDSC